MTNKANLFLRELHKVCDAIQQCSSDVSLSYRDVQKPHGVIDTKELVKPYQSAVNLKKMLNSMAWL